MRKHTLLSTAFAILFVTACSKDIKNSDALHPYSFAHETSDLVVDEAIEYGRLPNGLRYAVRTNATPTKTATLLMRIDTGSINENDETRGLAHFLEHMAFNGSENIPEGEMIKTLEKFGLAFGPDTNASTGFFETSYQLELPEVDEVIINKTLMIMRETADNLTLNAEAIERERGVILAEKRARSSPGFDAFLDSLDFYLGDTIIPERLYGDNQDRSARAIS
jgi:zinc protease